MKIIFFGTPEYVVPILNSLYKTYKDSSSESPIAAVVTQKPRRKGRKQELSYSSIDSWAHKKNIATYYSSKELLEKNVTADVGILASYGELIPKEVLNIFHYGILNVHPSLLPKFRGASPVQAAVLSGNNETGATIIKMDEKLDHGPIISQFKESIRDDDTTETLRNRLFEQSAAVLTTLIPAYIKGEIKPQEQEHKKATFTTLLTKSHGFIPPEYINKTLEGKSIDDKWKIDFIKNFTLNPNPYALERFVRAMKPWPEAWTEVKLTSNKKQAVKRLKILKAHTENQSLVLDEVQLEGKNAVSWEQFKRGHATFIFE